MHRDHVGHIDDEGFCMPTAGCDASSHFTEFVRGPRDKDHRRALCGKASCEQAADTPTSAGNQCDRTTQWNGWIGRAG
ncbi:hypothetical protein BJI69_20220 [Luteibacter rhizovicinus DSM 16549]|uniref:Uncharacterized protein n=1 Tax=Luteibacter rhizovicinus DSM 16549 TaxID=1440763 RepID=A0A1L3EY58_9GAMM|nr:hypothetical protein BJI69_20220 [Luteibacter rhizovicinus DSM 16549]